MKLRFDGILTANWFQSPINCLFCCCVSDKIRFWYDMNFISKRGPNFYVIRKLTYMCVCHYLLLSNFHYIFVIFKLNVVFHFRCHALRSMILSSNYVLGFDSISSVLWGCWLLLWRNFLLVIMLVPERWQGYKPWPNIGSFSHLAWLRWRPPSTRQKIATIATCGQDWHPSIVQDKFEVFWSSLIRTKTCLHFFKM